MKKLIVIMITFSSCIADIAEVPNTNNKTNNKTASNNRTRSNNKTTSNNKTSSNNRTASNNQTSTANCKVSTEVCDKIDNDCDGLVDEDLACCFKKSDCNQDQECSDTNECVGCVDNSSCTLSSTSKCDANVCVGCQGTSDCSHIGGKDVCWNNECVECAGNNDCDNGDKCDPNKNVCAKCLQNSDCGAKKCKLDKIDPTKNECVFCIENTTCNNSQKSLCTNGGSCADCVVDADCSHIPNKNYCSGGNCVACKDDSTCNGKACGTYERKCSNIDIKSAKQCEKCVSDSSCAFGFRCVRIPTQGGVCLKKYPGTCDRPYRTVIHKTSFDGDQGNYCAPYAGTTCAALVYAGRADRKDPPFECSPDNSNPFTTCAEGAKCLSRNPKNYCANDCSINEDCHVGQSCIANSYCD